MKLRDETFGFFVLLLSTLFVCWKRLERAQVLRKTKAIIKSSRIVLVFLETFYVFLCFQKSKGFKGKKIGRKWNSMRMNWCSTGSAFCKWAPWHNSPFVLRIWTFYPGIGAYAPNFGVTLGFRWWTANVVRMGFVIFCTPAKFWCDARVWESQPFAPRRGRGDYCSELANPAGTKKTLRTFNF